MKLVLANYFEVLHRFWNLL